MPYLVRLHRRSPARAARRHRPHHAVELSDADLRPLASARALATGNACVVKPAEDACLTVLRGRGLAARGGLARRRAQRRHRPGRGGRRRARRASGRRPHLLHRLAGHRGAGGQAAAAKRHCPVTLELGGKGAADRLRRRRPRRGAARCSSTPIMQNAGQTCSAAAASWSRRRVYEEVLAQHGRALRARCAAALPPRTSICGPLISRRQLERVAGLSGDGAATTASPVAARAASSPDAPTRTATTWRRRCCATCLPGPCSPGGDLRSGAGADALRRRGRGDRASPTAPPSAWSPASGRGTAARQLRMARALAAARYSSTTTAPAAASSCRSAASSTRATAARRASRRCTASSTLKTVVIQHG